MVRGGAERGRGREGKRKRGKEADTQRQQVCESSSQRRRRKKERRRRRRNRSERNSVAAVSRDTNTERGGDTERREGEIPARFLSTFV